MLRMMLKNVYKHMLSTVIAVAANVVSAAPIITHTEQFYSIE